MWTNDLKQEAERLPDPDPPSLPCVTRAQRCPCGQVPTPGGTGSP